MADKVLVSPQSALARLLAMKAGASPASSGVVAGSPASQSTVSSAAVPQGATPTGGARDEVATDAAAAGAVKISAQSALARIMGFNASQSTEKGAKTASESTENTTEHASPVLPTQDSAIEPQASTSQSQSVGKPDEAAIPSPVPAASPAAPVKKRGRPKKESVAKSTDGPATPKGKAAKVAKAAAQSNANVASSSAAAASSADAEDGGSVASGEDEVKPTAKPRARAKKAAADGESKPKKRAPKKPKAEAGATEEPAAKDDDDAKSDGSDPFVAEPDAATPAPKQRKKREPAANKGPAKPRTPRATPKKGKSLRDLVANLYKSLQTMVNIQHAAKNGTMKQFKVPMSKRSELLSDFVEKIATATGVPVESQKLMFRGKPMEPLDKEGKPATLFTYDVSPGAVVQLFLKKDAAEVAFAEDEPMPASEEPAVSQSAAASSAAAASTQAETAAPATPSPATRNDVVSRVAVGVNDDGTIDCDQPPGTVHNTDSGVPSDDGVVCRWGRVWVLASAPASTEVTPAKARKPAASQATPKSQEDKAGSEDEDGEFVPRDAESSESESDVSLVSSSDSDSSDAEEDLSIPTNLEECVGRCGLQSAGKSGQYDAVNFVAVDGDGITAASVGSEETYRLTKAEAIEAVKRFVDAKSAVSAKRSKRAKKPKATKAEKPAKGEKAVKGKAKRGKTAVAAGFVELHFTHGFAPKSRMPPAQNYRLLWRGIAEIDPESIFDAAVREVVMEEDAQRPFVVVGQAKVRHAPSDIIVKLPRKAVEAGEYTLGLTIRRDECSCSQCLGDDEVKSCQTCGCTVCFEKDNAEKIILCDECGKGYHHYCLDSVEGNHITIFDDGRDAQRQGNLSDAEFKELISSENEIGTKWCCPPCNVRNEVKAAEKAKKKRLGDVKQGWGGGMATMGYTKKCDMPADHIGRIPGVPVGTTFMARNKAAEAGIHRAPMAGIHGRANKGAFAICHSAGYENEDKGETLWYTGQGGRNLEGNKRTNTVHSKDQEMKLGNAALLSSHNAEDYKDGLPVRVLRGHKLDGKIAPDFAPVVPVGYDKAYRYDGLYKVAEFKEEKDESGFGVYKFLMIRDDTEPAVWTPEGRLPYARIIINTEKLVRQEIIAGGFGKQLKEFEETCAEALTGEPLPGTFSGLPLDADLNEEEEKAFARLESDPEFVDSIIGNPTLGREARPYVKRESAAKSTADNADEPAAVPRPNKANPEEKPTPRPKRQAAVAAAAKKLVDSDSDESSSESEAEPEIVTDKDGAPSPAPVDVPITETVAAKASDVEVEAPAVASSSHDAAASSIATKRRGAGDAKQKAAPSRKRAVSSESEAFGSEESEESEQSEWESDFDSEPVKAKSTRGRKPQPQQSPKKRKQVVSSESESSAESVESDEEPVKPASKSGRGKKPAAPVKSRKAAAARSESESSEGSVESDSEPIRKKKQVAKKPPARPQRASRRAQDSDDEVAAAPTSPSRLRSRRAPVSYAEIEVSDSTDDDDVVASEEEVVAEVTSDVESVASEPKPVKPSKKAATKPAVVTPKASSPSRPSPAPVSDKPAVKPTPVSVQLKPASTLAPGAEDPALVKAIEADKMNAHRWDTLRKTFRVAVPPMTMAKMEAISAAFRCAVTQELVTAPAVTPSCCKQNLNASSLKSCISKMDVVNACPLCRTAVSGGGKVVIGSAQFPVNSAMTDAIHKLFST